MIKVSLTVGVYTSIIIILIEAVGDKPIVTKFEIGIPAIDDVGGPLNKLGNKKI